MARYLVVGGTGMMGSVAVHDLFHTTKDEIVIAARHGAHEAAKKYKSDRVSGLDIDVTDKSRAATLFKDVDVVLNCAIYYTNLDVMHACLKAGCHYVDLGGLYHITKKQLALHKAFKDAGLTAVLGMGSTPGITNVLAAHGSYEFATIDSVDIKVGWADFSRRAGPPPPIPYAIGTLVDEFTKKPALFKNGRLAFVEPVSGSEVIPFPKPIGKKSAFYTLHSELATFPKSFKAKNVSFRVSFDEQFVSNIRYLVSTGMAGHKPINYNGVMITPLDFLSHVIAHEPQGKIVKREDYECLRVEITGRRKSDPKKRMLQIDCIARNSAIYGAGDIDTGTPPSIVAQMIAQKTIPVRGAVPPEFSIPEGPFFKELCMRGMNITKRWIA